MHRTSFLISALIAATGFAQQAPPQPEPPKPPAWYERVKLSGRAYLRYSVELGGAARGQSELAIDRLYLQGEFLPLDTLRFQVTLDAGDTRAAFGSNKVFVAQTKYAFVELKDLLARGLSLRAGVVPLMWISYEDDLWGFRVQGPAPVDRWGYMTSADLGVAFGGALPAKYGSFQVNVNNGEGYKSPEIGRGKELQGRLTVKPLAALGGLPAGLFVTVAGVWGHYDDPGLLARDKLRAIGQVGLQGAAGMVAAEYVMMRDPGSKLASKYTVGPGALVSGGLFSALGVFDLGAVSRTVEGFQLIARFDRLDPDTALPGNEQSLWIAGASYRWAPFAMTLLDYEAVLYGAGRPRDERLKLQTEVRF